jgi:hypothetical protein
MKKLCFLFISFIVIIVVGIPLYDIVAYYKNKSLISPLNEFIYQLAFANHKYWEPVAKIPLTNDVLHTAISHIHRGKYVVDVWIPERMKDFSEIKEDIKINCTFEKSNETIFKCCSGDNYKHFWTWSRGNDSGSNETYCYYHVPKDVPRNEKLSITIKISGDTEKFLQEHPNTYIVIRKGSDK